ncbi:MAG: aldolase/citrate lyase family protein [Pseudomonadota bacterium]
MQEDLNPGPAGKRRRPLTMGSPQLGAFLTIPNTYSAEIMTRAGWDILIIDMQHGAADYSDALTMLQIMSLGTVQRWVRVPSLDSDLIGRMLDAGAEGIIAPMVETADDVERLVRACTYPPRGQRSFGPLRPALTEDMTAYGASANDRILPIAMIETAAALEHLDDILSVDGLGAIYVGPTDLGISLGLPAAVNREDEVFEAALANIVERAASRGVPVCMHANSLAYAKRMVGRGFAMVTACADSELLGGGSNMMLTELRG